MIGDVATFGIFDWITDLFQAVWDFIKENWEILLIIAIVVVAIFAPQLFAVAWNWLTTTGFPALFEAFKAIGVFFADLGIGGAIAAGLGISMILNPEDTIEAIGSATGDLLESTGLGGLLPWLVGGLFVFWMLSGSDDDSNQDKVVIETRSDTASRDEYNQERAY